MEIISLKIQAVFDDGNGRLIPQELPCMLIPACSHCLRPGACICHQCGLPLCDSCATTDHICQNFAVKTPSLENTPRTIIEECESGDSGSTKELVVTTIPSIYEQIEASDYVPLEDDTILAKAMTTLGDILIQDEFVSRYFGTCMVDFKLLCQTSCCDYREGMVILNVDQQRAILLPRHWYYEPQYIGCYEAIEWYKKAKSAIGLIVKSHQEKVVCEIFEILQDDDEDFDVQAKIEYLMSVVSDWS